MFLARFHILQDEILPQRKLKLPEQQQYLWKRFLALLPDMLLLDCSLPSCSIQVAVLPFMWGTHSFLQVSLAPLQVTLAIVGSSSVLPSQERHM